MRSMWERYTETLSALLHHNTNQGQSEICHQGQQEMDGYKPDSTSIDCIAWIFKNKMMHIKEESIKVIMKFYIILIHQLNLLTHLLEIRIKRFYWWISWDCIWCKMIRNLKNNIFAFVNILYILLYIENVHNYNCVFYFIIIQHNTTIKITSRLHSTIENNTIWKLFSKCVCLLSSICVTNIRIHPVLSMKNKYYGIQQRFNHAFHEFHKYVHK